MDDTEKVTVEIERAVVPEIVHALHRHRLSEPSSCDKAALGRAMGALRRVAGIEGGEA